MSVTVLIIDTFAGAYRERLLDRFSSLTVHIARDASSIDCDLATVDVLMAFGIAINDDLIARCTNLKWVQSLATGVDHFLRCPHLMHKTLLTSARGIHGAPMRETVAWLMLSSARDALRIARNQDSAKWDRGQPWSLLDGKTATIVGIGVSTTAIAKLLNAFGMTTLGVTRTVRPVDGFDEVLPAEDLLAATARADYLINVLPSSIENRNRIDASVFAAMKPCARFINVGRGDTVDETALIEALEAGRIAGAALDVFRSGTLTSTSPLWHMPNVIISPHIAGFVKEYEALVMPILLDNMKCFLANDSSAMRNVIVRD